ncbi:MAG: hypothetical protein ACYTGL_15435, partial [Planctomycetota bacterium]
DPHEWNDLASDPDFAKVKLRLQAALKQWQAETHDPIADLSKLQRLLNENDAVFKAGRRSPKGGWQYLNYLAPTAAPWTDTLAP